MILAVAGLGRELSVRRGRIFFSLLLSVAFSASPARAVQQHGGAEGLVSHQIGHLLFIMGMSFLLFRVYQTRLKSPGWFEFKAFVWLILSWNFLTLNGHWMREYVDPNKYIKAGGLTVAFTVSNVSDALFYLSRLDHVLLVPSFFFLLLALRKWNRAA
jgi:hypothetical protein